MALQTSVNKQFAVGMAGEFVDDSPRRVSTAKGFGTKEVKATGTLTASGSFTATETVTIGVQTYTFVASSPDASAYEFTGATTAEALENLAKLVNGETVGSVANALVSATATSTTLVVTAKVGGTDGNSIATTETCTNAAFGGATLSSGADAVNAKIGVAYTTNGTEGEAVVGGNGVFLGVAVNPKEYIRYNNFNATMEIPNGITVQLCTFGHIFVKVADTVSVGQAGYFNTSTGAIKGATAGTDLSGSSYTEIKYSKFLTAANAGDIAVLELGA